MRRRATKQQVAQAVARLVAEADNARLEERDFDEDVHRVHSTMAGMINEGGLESQFAFLVRNGAWGDIVEGELGVREKIGERSRNRRT